MFNGLLLSTIISLNYKTRMNEAAEQAGFLIFPTHVSLKSSVYDAPPLV